MATIVGNYYEGCANFQSSGCNSKKMKISVNPGTTLSSKDTAWVTYDTEIPKGTFNPKSVYSYSADPVGGVKSLVTTYSGIGKIDISEYEKGTKIDPVIVSSSSVAEVSSSSVAESSSSDATTAIRRRVVPADVRKDAPRFNALGRSVKSAERFRWSISWF